MVKNKRQRVLRTVPIPFRPIKPEIPQLDLNPLSNWDAAITGLALCTYGGYLSDGVCLLDISLMWAIKFCILCAFIVFLYVMFISLWKK